MTVIDCQKLSNAYTLVVATVNLADCVAMPFGSPIDFMRFSNQKKQVTCLRYRSM